MLLQYARVLYTMKMKTVAYNTTETQIAVLV